VRVCENLKLLKGAYLSYGHPQLVWCSLRSLEVITDPALFCTMQKCEAGGATFNWCNHLPRPRLAVPTLYLVGRPIDMHCPGADLIANPVQKCGATSDWCDHLPRPRLTVPTLILVGGLIGMPSNGGGAFSAPGLIDTHLDVKGKHRKQSLPLGHPL